MPREISRVKVFSSQPLCLLCSADDSKCLHRLQKSSCMIDRLVHTPPSSTVCEASESTLCCCCRQTLPLVLVLSARPAAHSRGRILRDPPPAGSAQPAVLIFIIELVPLLASSVLVSDGPAPPPGPRLLPVSAPGLSRIT